MSRMPHVLRNMLASLATPPGNLVAFVVKGQTLRLGALYMGVGALISMVLSYAFNILAGRMLGPAGYGLISILFSLAITISSLCFMGSARAIAKYSADFEAMERSAYPVLIVGLKIHSILIGGLLLLGIVFDDVVTDNVFDGNRFLTQALIMTVALYGVSMLIGGALQGLRELKYLSIYRLAQPLSRLVSFLILVALISSSLMAASIAQIVVPLVGLWAAVPLYKRFQHRLFPAPFTFPIQEFLAFSMPATFLQGSGMLMANLAPLLAKLVATGDSNSLAGSMTAALLIIRGPLFLFQAFYDSLFPYASRAIVMKDFDRVKRYVSVGIQLSLLVMFIVIVAILPLGDMAIKMVFGQEFTTTKVDLLMFAVFAVFYFSASLLTNILMGWGRLWPLFGAWMLGVLVAILFSLLGPFTAAMRIETGLALGALVTSVSLSIRYYLVIK